MSNTLINGVIALIENRPKDARTILRSPELKVPIGEVQTRLAIAIEKREKAAKIEALECILNTSLRVDVGVLFPKFTDSEKEGFVAGITHLENIIYDAIAELKT